MRYLSLLTALTIALMIGSVRAQGSVPVSIAADLDPNSATGIRIEGLVADQAGRLYTVDLDSARFFRITPETGAVEVLATLPRPASGMAFDRAGNLYMASQDVILRIAVDRIGAADFDPAADVLTFATGVPGANGLAFDGAGNLYVSGGNTGTIYVVAPDGAVRAFVSGLVSDRQEQQISTNGLQFGLDGRLYSANTGTGAIDRIALNPDGSAGPVERFVTDPLLLGADGIVFAANGDLYVAANERNAIVRVTPAGQVSDVAVNGNAGPLQFPASPAFAGTSLYASNFDIPQGANAPADPGVGASIARVDVGVVGLPLPAASATQPTASPTMTPAGQLPPSATQIPAYPAPQPTTPGDLPTPAVVIEIPAYPAPQTTPAATTAPGFPVVPVATPLPAGGAVRLPDTGTTPSTPWFPLAIVAMLVLVAGLTIGRSRRSMR